MFTHNQNVNKEFRELETWKKMAMVDECLSTDDNYIKYRFLDGIFYTTDNGEIYGDEVVAVTFEPADKYVNNPNTSPQLHCLECVAAIESASL